MIRNENNLTWVTVLEKNVSYQDYNQEEYEKFLEINPVVTVTKTVNFPTIYKYEEKDYIKHIYPDNVQFKILSTKQNEKTLTHFVITDYPLKVDNAWGQQLFDIPNTKVVMKCKPVEKYKAIKRIDNAINELLSQNTLGKASSQIDRQTHLESLQVLQNFVKG